MPFREELRKKLLVLKEEFESGLLPESIYGQMCKEAIDSYGDEAFADPAGIPSPQLQQQQWRPKSPGDHFAAEEANVGAKKELEQLKIMGNIDGRKFNRGADHRRSYTTDEKLEVLRLRDSGMSFEAIKQTTGVSNVNMIKRWCSVKGRERIISKHRKSLEHTMRSSTYAHSEESAHPIDIEVGSTAGAAIAAIDNRLQAIQEMRRAGSASGPMNVDGSLAALLLESQHQLNRSNKSSGDVTSENIPVSPVDSENELGPALKNSINAAQTTSVEKLPTMMARHDSSITMAINDTMLRRNPFNINTSDSEVIGGSVSSSLNTNTRVNVINSSEAAANGVVPSNEGPATRTRHKAPISLSVTQQTTRPILPNTKYLIDRKRKQLLAVQAANARKKLKKQKMSTNENSGSLFEQIAAARAGSSTMRELIEQIDNSDDEGYSSGSGGEIHADEKEDDDVMKLLGE